MTIEKSIISNHSWLKHEGKQIEVKMKMLKKYRCDPTGRQNAEAILIRNSNQDFLMNSKQEHRQPIDIKEKYENSKGVWEGKKLEKRTIIEKEKLRFKIKKHLLKNQSKEKCWATSDDLPPTAQEPCRNLPPIVLESDEKICSDSDIKNEILKPDAINHDRKSEDNFG